MNIPKGHGDYSVNLTIGQMHAFLSENGAKFVNPIQTANEWIRTNPVIPRLTGDKKEN